MLIQNKVAIITGAGQGIGKAIALTFANEGGIPVIVDQNGKTALSVESQVKASGGRALAYELDVSNVSGLKTMVEYVVAEFGTVDILVNNAGILHSTKIEDITEQEWDKMMNVNLKSTFFAMQQVLPYMKKQKQGRIINISSLAGRMGGYQNGVAYSASKAGIIGLTMAVARRVAEYNITVNAVAPGTTESEIIKQFSQDQQESLRLLIPLQRLGKPQNIADVVAFLASDKAEFITGATIDINGGMFMG